MAERTDIHVEGPLPVGGAILRVRRLGDDGAAALSAAFGLDWPVRPNTVGSGETTAVLWLAPGEWLVLGGEAEDVARRVAAALGGALHHLADMSHAWLSFHIDGAASREFLARGCSLDLHRRAFAADACAQTLFAQCFAVLRRLDDDDAFELIVDRALADWLRAWLDDALADLAANGPA